MLGKVGNARIKFRGRLRDNVILDIPIPTAGLDLFNHQVIALRIPPLGVR
jgi:hypothetical protein